MGRSYRWKGRAYLYNKKKMMMMMMVMMMIEHIAITPTWRKGKPGSPRTTQQNK